VTRRTSGPGSRGKARSLPRWTSGRCPLAHRNWLDKSGRGWRAAAPRGFRTTRSGSSFEKALARGAKIFPCCSKTPACPPPSKCPSTWRAIVDLTALRLRDSDWGADLDAIVGALVKAGFRQDGPAPPAPAPLSAQGDLVDGMPHVRARRPGETTPTANGGLVHHPDDVGDSAPARRPRLARNIYGGANPCDG